MKAFHKILSILVVTAMMLSLLPMTTFAVDEVPQGITVGVAHANYIYCNGISVMIKEVEGNTYIYDIDGVNRLFDTALEGVLYVFGGAETATVASTKIIMNSGRIGGATSGYLYAGGGGTVTGLAEVIVNGGFVSSVYGCGSTGTTGSVKIEYTNSSIDNPQQALVVGGKGIIYRDVNITLNNPNLTTLCGGSNAAAAAKVYIGGDINITINGGSVTNIYGGNVYNNVNGSVNIDISGDTQVSGLFYPMNKLTNNLVAGGATVYVPESFDTSNIITTYKNGTPNNEIYIFKNGIQIYGPAQVTSDNINKNIFANGTKVTAKVNEADGMTYLYNIKGAKILKFPIDDYKIYGGSSTQNVASANIAIESGRVAAVYGSGLNGNVSGTAYIKIAEGATVIGSVYSNSAVGKSNSSVIWVPYSFDMSKVLSGENTRIFKGSIELPDTSIAIPKVVTVEGNYVFANGIPIVVKIDKKDKKDGRTYVYDSKGNTKLLATEVNGMEIYGGSSKGVVASTNVSMESGTVSRIYGGGFTSCVTGMAEISITGGDVTEVIYGGSYDGDVGGTDIYTSGPYVAKGVNAGSRNGTVLGDTKVLLKKSVAKGLYAGTGGEGRGDFFPSSDVLGNASYTLINGMAEKIYGGCKSGVIRGTSTITIKGQTIIKSGIFPQGNGGVLGGATVNVPSNYTYMDTITKGTGITVNLTEAAEIELVPTAIKRTEEVMSTEGDIGKLVYRFINIPEPDGNLTGRPGEAIYITFPNGQNMLIDAGGNTDYCMNLLYDFLDGMGVTNIDYLVATHYHSDHVGSMDDILNKYSVGKLLTTGFKVPTTTVYNTNLKNWIAANADKVEYLWRGNTFNIGDVQFEALNPLESDTIKATMNGSPETDDFNNYSLVLRMTYGEHTSMMSADMYIAAEKELLSNYSTSLDKLKVDLIKVPHHGDTTSSDPEFVRAVSPDIAVITHISDTLIVNNRYKGVGADTYVTGVDGIIKVVYDGVNEAPNIVTQYYIPETKD